ncbi:SPOR domain-containing protein [Paenibacillus sp. sptzw28]|uniref:SPOR domain-containing protein n=1 Tax=Paenibacillus sp. sptzw28 TaxID=715179 RepID=UPI001C6EDDF8|nr:SPOR domain-containing protein [Paenibacillus sp. sptzw28]QYR23373.1 SPOR domain-containing protein [Paenibacillus sp. sptzw28]
MNSKARITFRFDKENGARVERKPEEKERPIKSNVVPFFQEELKFSSDAGTWNSPFQDDSSALEQLIRETDNRPSAPLPPHTSRTASEERIHRAQAAPKLTTKLTTKQQSAQYETSLNPPQHYHYEWVDHVPLGDELAGNSAAREPEAYPVIELDEFDNRDKGKLHSGAVSPFKTAKTYGPSRGPSWYKVFASVTGAIVTGALFGYFVLALFTGEPADESGDLPAVGSPVSNTAAIANTGQQTAGGKADNNIQSGTNPVSTSAIKVDVPETSYYMLQFGVFSNKEGSDAAVAELKGKGLAAAALSTPEGYRVYVGMAADRDNAFALSQTLAGMDVYIKQVEVPSLSAIPFKGDAAVVESFFKQTDQLLRLMNGMTIGKLGQTAVKVDGSWSELHQQWTKSASIMESGIVGKEEKAALLSLVQQVNTAAVAAQEYAKNQSEAHLWTIQTALMKAVFAEQEWFVSMGGL